VASVFSADFRVRVVETFFLHRPTDFGERLRTDRFETIAAFTKFEVQRREGGSPAFLVARSPAPGLAKIADALHDLCEAGEAVREATLIGSEVGGRRVVDTALMAKIENMCDAASAQAVRALEPELGPMNWEGWHAHFSKDRFLSFLSWTLPFHTSAALGHVARAAENLPTPPLAPGELPKSVRCLLQRGRPLAESLVVLERA
jgi:hypothetical protein